MTGGEPLVRKDIEEITKELGLLKGKIKWHQYILILNQKA
jgi:molybdenum cofactor biosynthesis enzyme MoaA